MHVTPFTWRYPPSSFLISCSIRSFSDSTVHATSLTWRDPPSYFSVHFTSAYQCHTKLFRYIGARHAINLAISSILFPVHFASAHQCHTKLLRYIGARHAVILAESSIHFWLNLAYRSERSFHTLVHTTPLIWREHPSFFILLNFNHATQFWCAMLVIITIL